MTIARRRLTIPWKRLPLPSVWVIGFALLVVAALLISSHGRKTPYENDVVLADAMLHGHLWVDRHDTVIDSLAYNGRNWVIEGPVPALLLVPVVAVFKTANQTTEALVLCLVALGAGLRLLRHLGLDRPARGRAAGVPVRRDRPWWCSMLGDVWFIAHTAAVAFTLLALAEAFGRKRGWLVGLWAVLAFGSRFSMIMALPLYGGLLFAQAEDRAAG